MHKTTLLLLPLLAVACAAQNVAAPIDAPIAAVAPTAMGPLPPPDVPRDTSERFPAGPGVTLMADQFHALVRERRVSDARIPYQERVAIAEKALGLGGEPIFEPNGGGVVFRGVATRSMVAPFGCTELLVLEKGPPAMTRTADHRLCGLPYAGESKAFNGPAPKRSAFRLEEIAAEVSGLAPFDAEMKARVKLGTPDFTENGRHAWAGLGPRSKDAPISCRLLTLSPGGGSPTIEDAPLTSCSLAWPMPGMTFERGSDEPALDKDGKLAECSKKCSANEICMIDQRVPSTATVRVEADGSRARYPDGRAAKAELVASCIAIPSTCSTVNASCFFPLPPVAVPGAPPPNPLLNAAPCPKDDHSARAFFTAPTNHIMCFTDLGGAPTRRSVVALPRTIAPAPPAKPSAKRLPQKSELY